MCMERKCLLKLHVNEQCSKPMYSSICFKLAVKLKHVKFSFRVYMAHMWSVKIYQLENFGQHGEYRWLVGDALFLLA